MCSKCNGAGYISVETEYDYHKNLTTYEEEKCPRCDGRGLLKIRTRTFAPLIDETPYDPAEELIKRTR